MDDMKSDDVQASESILDLVADLLTEEEVQDVLARYEGMQRQYDALVPSCEQFPPPDCMSDDDPASWMLSGFFVATPSQFCDPSLQSAADTRSVALVA